MLVGHLQWSGGEEEMVGARLVWADFFFFCLHLVLFVTFRSFSCSMWALSGQHMGSISLTRD